MPNFNRVILMGNLTRDPDLRYTPNGQAVADFRLAVNRRSRTAEGERRDSTTFVDVTAWGRQAEIINEYFTKGRPIFLEGRLQLDEWTSSDGQRRSKLKVVLDRFEFITPREGSHEPRAASSEPQATSREPEPPSSQPEAPSSQPEAPSSQPPPSSFDDDVPF